jgi:type IV fimbrial biogenesis protein FimT
MSRQTGYSLVELMITIVIGTILLSAAVPAFQTLIRNNRLVSTTNDFVAYVNLARSEAVKRGTEVVLCRRNPAGAPACQQGNDWSQGWLLFVNPDGNNALGGADTLLQVGQGTEAGVSLMANNAAIAVLRYNPDGTINTISGAPVFAICDERGSAHPKARSIAVGAIGRPELVDGTSGITCPP